MDARLSAILSVPSVAPSSAIIISKEEVILPKTSAVFVTVAFSLSASLYAGSTSETSIVHHLSGCYELVCGVGHI